MLSLFITWLEGYTCLISIKFVTQVLVNARDLNLSDSSQGKLISAIENALADRQSSYGKDEWYDRYRWQGCHIWHSDQWCDWVRCNVCLSRMKAEFDTRENFWLYTDEMDESDAFWCGWDVRIRLWDVTAHWLRRWLSTRGSWVRLLLQPPRRDAGQVLYLQLPVRFGVKLRYSIRAV